MGLENKKIMILEKDPRWNVFDTTKDKDQTSFQATLPLIYLKDNVHTDIKNTYKVIEKLLCCSYFEYEFFDDAILKSLLTFEMALKVRYKEVTLSEWPKGKPLRSLIYWFHSRRYFEVYNDLFLDNLRQIRNMAAHPYSHTFSGPTGKNLILHVMDLINDLYDDIDLRKKRMSIHKKHTENLRYMLQGGAILTIEETVYLIYEARVGFVNNKIHPTESKIFFIPAFHIPENFKTEPKLCVIDAIPVAALSYTREKGTMTFSDPQKSRPITLTKISDTQTQREYDEWKSTYLEYSNYTGFDLLLHTDISNFSENARREFHKL